jgi:hypothetical protein
MHTATKALRFLDDAETYHSSGLGRVSSNRGCLDDFLSLARSNNLPYSSDIQSTDTPTRLRVSIVGLASLLDSYDRLSETVLNQQYRLSTFNVVNGLPGNSNDTFLNDITSCITPVQGHLREDISLTDTPYSVPIPVPLSYFRNYLNRDFQNANCINSNFIGLNFVHLSKSAYNQYCAFTFSGGNVNEEVILTEAIPAQQFPYLIKITQLHSLMAILPNCIQLQNVLPCTTGRMFNSWIEQPDVFPRNANAYENTFHTPDADVTSREEIILGLRTSGSGRYLPIVAAPGVNQANQIAQKLTQRRPSPIYRAYMESLINNPNIYFTTTDSDLQRCPFQREINDGNQNDDAALRQITFSRWFFIPSNEALMFNCSNALDAQGANLFKFEVRPCTLRVTLPGDVGFNDIDTVENSFAIRSIFTSFKKTYNEIIRMNDGTPNSVISQFVVDNGGVDKVIRKLVQLSTPELLVAIKLLRHAMIADRPRLNVQIQGLINRLPAI